MSEYEKKLAERFAAIKPAVFDFWSELDYVIAHAFFDDDGTPLGDDNVNQHALALAYVYLCYGIHEEQSIICEFMIGPVRTLLKRKEFAELAIIATAERKEHEQCHIVQ